MGGSSSKVEPISGGDGAPSAAKSKAEEGNIKAMRAAAIQKCADDKKLFDAHCYYTNYMQETEGMEALAKAMDKSGIGYAAICGTSFKKTWVGETDADGKPKERSKPPVHHLYDDGDLYYYCATDGNLYRQLDAYKKKAGLESIAKFSMMLCGLNLGDYSCGDEAKQLLINYPVAQGFGVITLQSDDINNVTVKGGNWTFTEPSVKKIIKVCADNKLPFVFYSDARSSTSKPSLAESTHSCASRRNGASLTSSA